MMNKLLTGGLKIQNRKLKNITRSPNQYHKYDPEDKVSAIIEYKDYVVVIDDTSKINKESFLPFPPTEDIKTLMYHIYHNDILSYA